jgi:hypothetical protein
MSRQYFEDLIIDPPVANIVATTSTVETGLWNVAQYSPIHAFDGYKGTGKVYRLCAGGIFSTSSVAPTLILTARLGTSSTSASLGTSVTQTLPASLTNEPWFLHSIWVVRALGAPGLNSTVAGTGIWNGGGVAGTAASNATIGIGGVPNTACDLSIETGIFLGASWSTTLTNSITVQWITMQSLN